MTGGLRAGNARTGAIAKRLILVGRAGRRYRTTLTDVACKPYRQIMGIHTRSVD
jgi:hypothetical protein